MDFIGAVAFAENHLETALPNHLHYHNIHHTRDVVVPAVERLAKAHGLPEHDAKLLRTAAWFHDTGFSKRYRDNEIIGANIAERALPKYDYTDEDIARIRDLILATQLSHEPQNMMEAIISDADLDTLGRADFLASAERLRTEEAQWNLRKFTDVEWYRFEMQFLSSHRYHTRAQRRFRNSGKVQNYLKVAQRMILYRDADVPASPRAFKPRDTQPIHPI